MKRKPKHHRALLVAVVFAPITLGFVFGLVGWSHTSDVVVPVSPPTQIRLLFALPPPSPAPTLLNQASPPPALPPPALPPPASPPLHLLPASPPTPSGLPLPIPPVGQVGPIAFVSINRSGANSTFRGFMGWNNEMATMPLAAVDTDLRNRFRDLAPGWLRFPGGCPADTYNFAREEYSLVYQNFLYPYPARFDSGNLSLPVFYGSPGTCAAQSSNSLYTMAAILGGQKFSDVNNLAMYAGSPGHIVTLNGWSDDPANAGVFAARHMHEGIIAYELTNEPQLNPDPAAPFPTKEFYMQKMANISRYVFAADLGARVMLPSFGDLGNKDSIDAWLVNNSRFWNFTTMHLYPCGDESCYFQTLLNAPSMVRNRADPLVPVAITEFAIDVLDNGTGYTRNANPRYTTYSGAINAEFGLRLIETGVVSHVGVQAITDNMKGILTNSYDHHWDVGFYDTTFRGERGGIPTNTSTFPFGWNDPPYDPVYNPYPVPWDLYLSAFAVGYSVASKASNYADFVYKTNVQGGGTAYDNVTSIPAIYALAFGNSTGLSLVVINKSNVSVPISVSDTAGAIPGSVLVQTAWTVDPNTANIALGVAVDSTGANVTYITPPPFVPTDSSAIYAPPYSIMAIYW